MPSDLSVPRIGAVPAGPDPARTRPATPQPSAGQAIPPQERGDDKPLANPALRLDPGLAIVVIEFRDGDGKLRETIPTQAQLDAYRSWQRRGAAEVPGAAGGAREPAALAAERARPAPPAAGGGTAADGGSGTAGSGAAGTQAQAAAAMKDASGRREVKASETGGA